MTSPSQPSARLKRAETTSVFGAGVLGAGIALLLPTDVRRYAALIAAMGLVTHAWGMYDKHRLETSTGANGLWWAGLLYWLCWFTLAVLVIYLLMARA